MYLSDRMIYLQIQKTGGTHIARLLEKYDGGVTMAKHQPLADWAANRDKCILTSIRNPWDWYVSLWAYGCSRRGGLQAHLRRTPVQQVAQSARRRLAHAVRGARGPKPEPIALRRAFQPNLAPVFRDVLSDAQNAAHFRRWLSLVLGEAGKTVLPEGYAQSAMKQAVGYFTYRFLRLATRSDAFAAQAPHLAQYDDIVGFYETQGILDQVIRNEDLETDLATALTRVGIETTPDVLRAEGKTNTSQRGRYATYYDEESIALVRTRERFLIETFGYEFDR